MATQSSRWLWNVHHEIFCLLRFIFMRDRLRCPSCRKVGTWKPHKYPRRWLCKWCGWYRDINGDNFAWPCRIKKVWMLKPRKKGKTPADMVRRVDPWKG